MKRYIVKAKYIARVKGIDEKIHHFYDRKKLETYLRNNPGSSIVQKPTSEWKEDETGRKYKRIDYKSPECGVGGECFGTVMDSAGGGHFVCPECKNIQTYSEDELEEMGIDMRGEPLKSPIQFAPPPKRLQPFLKKLKKYKPIDKERFNSVVKETTNSVFGWKSKQLIDKINLWERGYDDVEGDENKDGVGGQIVGYIYSLARKMKFPVDDRIGFGLLNDFLDDKPIKKRYITKKEIMKQQTIYLKPGEKAPEGVKVQTGKRGGQYYIAGGKETPAKPTTPTQIQAPAPETPAAQSLKTWQESLTPTDKAMYDMLDDKFKATVIAALSNEMIKLGTKVLGVPQVGAIISRVSQAHQQKQTQAANLESRGQARAEKQPAAKTPPKPKPIPAPEPVPKPDTEEPPAEPISVKDSMISWAKDNPDNELAQEWLRTPARIRQPVIDRFTELGITGDLKDYPGFEAKLTELLEAENELQKGMDDLIKFDRPNVLYHEPGPFTCATCPNRVSAPTYESKVNECHIVDGAVSPHDHCKFWGTLRKPEEKLSRWETAYAEDGTDYNCAECRRWQGSGCLNVAGATPEGSCCLWVKKE